MKITVIGCGRWGSFIAWYLHRQRMEVTLYGRETSPSYKAFVDTRTNGQVTLPSDIGLTTDLAAVAEGDIIVISIGSQGLRGLMAELAPLGLMGKTFVLCMKGIEVESGKRLSQIVAEHTHETNRVMVWLGPGHVEEFLNGVPNCMVIDGVDQEEKERLVGVLSSDLIRFYYGNDLIGNEVGAAAKNVIGIAAGLLDGFGLSALKGALMARGTREIARLIKAMGGDERSAYGLCHLGDYEATVFSPHSKNRRFGECIITGEAFSGLAEGYYTVAALMGLKNQYMVDLPISQAVYRVLYEKADPRETLNGLFLRSIKQEF
ncbi:glycerol-3-phosphate dehydrogenase [Eubacteriales bacterium OttesenSCG-928-M02]|nr:glycerol-3-phosphate dehydrogenase [Eubacteriales bacterium OttesenSCG-928-M02]